MKYDAATYLDSQESLAPLNDRLKDWMSACGSQFKNLIETKKAVFVSFNASAGLSYSSQLFEGRWHSKGPLQKNEVIQWNCLIDLPNGTCVQVSGTGFQIPSEMFRRLNESMECALPSRFRRVQNSRHTYPALDFSNHEILSAQSLGAQKVQELVCKLWDHLKTFEHPRLMGRECSVGLSISSEGYWDTTGNEALQSTTSVDLSWEISLKDYSDFGSESYGHLPSDQEIAGFVEDTTLHLRDIEQKTLKLEMDWKVVILPQAFQTLLEDLVFPNLSARSLLRGESRFGIESVGEKMLPRLTIQDNPHLKGSPFSQIFDAEGCPTVPVQVLKQGVFLQPLLTSSQSRELAELLLKVGNRNAVCVATGHASGVDSTQYTNQLIELAETPVCKSAPEKCAHQVILVHSLTGMSANPLTGGFSLDAEGARVYQDGTLASTSNFTLSGSIDEILADPDLLQTPLKRLHNCTLPGLITSRLTCVTKSGADHLS